MSKHIVMFLNSAELFLSHRQHLAQGVVSAGYRLTVLVPPGRNVETIRSLGYPCVTVPLARKSIFPIFELYAMLNLCWKLRRLRPDILHSFTIKPVLYGSFVGRWLRVPRVVNTITGLGFAFIDSGLKARLVRSILSCLYRSLFLDSRFQFIFQNGEDMNFYIAKKWIRENQSNLIPGTGVDLEVFQPSHVEKQPEIPVVLFAGRYLRDKGLGELMAACSELWTEGVKFRLILSGQIDRGNPNSFSSADVARWRELPFTEELGFQNNMPQIYRMCEIMCLPSYREGLPLALIEASACGCALVATDVPGCRDIVISGQNGFLVPSRSVAKLKSALLGLMSDRNLCSIFGKEARALAVRKYDKVHLVAHSLKIYEVTPGRC